MTEIAWKPGDPPLARYSPEPGKYLRLWRQVKASVVTHEAIREARRPILAYEWGVCLDAESFLRALQRRINARVGPEPRWRKLDPMFQRELERDVIELRQCRADRRLRPWGLNGRRWRTDLVQARYGHLIQFDPDEYR